MRRFDRFLLRLALLSLVASTGALSACRDQRAGPDASGGANHDIILIVLDTTRADRLGMYGHDRPVSPNLDRFAGDSVVFDRAWSTASWTLPAHASMLTGQYPTSHGAHITPFTDGDSNGAHPAHLREEAVTLAELLAPRGYRSAAFAGAGWLSPEFGLLQGYDVKDAKNNRTLPAADISERALRWLHGVPRDQPVHLLLNYFDPHWPYEPAPPYDRYARAGSDVAIPTLGEILGGKTPSPAQIAKMRDLYDGEIEYMDHHVGRVLDGLRASGRYDDAIIIVLADHGELFGEHGDLGHGAWLWEELVRIPLVVHFPGGRGGGTRDDRPVSIVDLLPWIAAELGLELPKGVDGLALGARDLVVAEEFPNKLFVKLGGERMRRNLVSGVSWPWKLIASSRGKSELFRIDEDPHELHPIGDRERTQDIATRLETLRASLHAPLPDRSRTMSPEALEQLRELGYVE